MGIKKKSPFVTALEIPTTEQPGNSEYIADIEQLEKMIMEHYKKQF